MNSKAILFYHIPFHGISFQVYFGRAKNLGLFGLIFISIVIRLYNKCNYSVP